MVRRIFRHLILTLAIILSTLTPVTSGQAVTYPTAEVLNAKKAPFLATIWRISGNWNRDGEGYACVENCWRVGSDLNVDDQGYQCGAALYSKSVAITAAHCLLDEDGQLREDLVVIAGDPRLEMPYTGEVLAIWDWKVHPRYSRKTGQNDIAVGFLKFDSRFGSERPLEIASSFKSSSTWLYGWGKNQFKKLPSSARRVQQIDYSRVASDFYEDFNPRSMIAAGFLNKKERVFAGACQGDSGSPLVVMEGSVPKLLGIVSNGAEECDSRIPTIYTRVSFYKSYINNAIRDLQRDFKDAGATRPAASDLTKIAGEIGSLPFEAVQSQVNGKQALTQQSRVTLQRLTNSQRKDFVADISYLTFNVLEIDQDTKWVLDVYLSAPLDRCTINKTNELMVQVARSYQFHIYTLGIKPRVDCYDTTDDTPWIPIDIRSAFNARSEIKQLLTAGKCSYPMYRPFSAASNLVTFDGDLDKGKNLVAGWQILLDPKCTGLSPNDVWFRLVNEVNRYNIDIEPGLGMWIGPFKGELKR